MEYSQRHVLLRAIAFPLETTDIRVVQEIQDYLEQRNYWMWKCCQPKSFARMTKLARALYDQLMGYVDFSLFSDATELPHIFFLDMFLDVQTLAPLFIDWADINLAANYGYQIVGSADHAVYSFINAVEDTDRRISELAKLDSESAQRAFRYSWISSRASDELHATAKYFRSIKSDDTLLYVELQAWLEQYKILIPVILSRV